MSKVNRRSQLREAVFLILFRVDFHEDGDIKEQTGDFFEGEDEFSEAERDEVAAKVSAICSKIEAIDGLLNRVIVGWKTTRMTKVDLTALRIACYEIIYDGTVPAASAINEAVELAKNYGTESSGSFVNGVLAKVLAARADGRVAGES